MDELVIEYPRPLGLRSAVGLPSGSLQAILEGADALEKSRRRSSKQLCVTAWITDSVFVEESVISPIAKPGANLSEITFREGFF